MSDFTLAGLVMGIVVESCLMDCSLAIMNMVGDEAQVLVVFHRIEL